MSRVLWQGRVWTTAAAVALALVTGTWIVMDDRLTWRVLDDVVLADMMLDRIAALEYAEDPIDVTGWTTLRYTESPTESTWGGYEWVQVANVPAAAGAAFNRTYHFARRERIARNPNFPIMQLIPDRGFCDIYTNSIYLLTDLGPSGGSASASLFGRSGTVPVGGWVLHGGFLNTPLFLPPHFPVSSGHFLSPGGTGTYDRWALFTSLAPAYDPNDITVLTGPVDTTRLTTWHPRSVYFTTNEIMHLPAAHEEWGGVGYSYGEGPLDGSDPRVIIQPQSAILRLADQFTSSLSREPEPRIWCDAELATAGSSSDFDGWTNTAPPLLSANTGHLARVSAWLARRNSNRTVRALGPYRALGNAVMDCRTLWVAATWTNVVHRQYISRVAQGPGATFRDLVSELADNPGWELDFETNYPSRGSVGVRWGIDGDYGAYYGTNYLRLAYEILSGTPVASLGASHGPDGWDEATAHLSLSWHTPSELAVPTGSGLIEERNTLQRHERVVSPDWPIHEFETFPAFAPPARADILRIPDDAVWSLDFRMGYYAALVVTASPTFTTPLED